MAECAGGILLILIHLLLGFLVDNKKKINAM